MANKRILLITAAILIAAGLAGIYLTSVPARVQRISFPSGGENVHGILYLPSGAESDTPIRYPLVMLLPGISTPAECYDPLARELTRRGYAACALFIPSTRSIFNFTAVNEGIKYITTHFHDIDGGKRAVMGHSLGAATAVETAFFDPEMQAVITVGYYIGGEVSERPKNLLLGTGFYDDLNGPGKLRNGVATFDKALEYKEGNRIGSFENGNALGFFISPYANHASETDDLYFIEKSLNWLDRSFYNRINKKPLIYHFRFISVFLLQVGLFPALTFLALNIFNNSGAKGRLFWSACLTCLVLLGFLLKIEILFVVRAFMLMLLSGLAAAYFMKKTGARDSAADAFSAGFERFAAGLIQLYLCFILSQFFFNLPRLIEHPRYFPHFPGYVFVSFFLHPCNLIKAAISYLHFFYPPVLMIIMFSGLILFLREISRPGLMGRKIEKIREGIRRFATYEKKGKTDVKTIFITVACLLLMGGAWFRVHRMGLFHIEIILPYIGFILQYLMVPLLIWLILIKILSMGKKRIEN